MDKLKTMKKYICFLTFGLILTICSCVSDQLPEAPEVESCPPIPVSYDVQVQTIIDRTCSYEGCHDGSGAAPGNFTSFDGIENFLTETLFERRVIDLQNMPDPDDVLPSELLTDEEFNILRCWVEQGYLEN